MKITTEKQAIITKILTKLILCIVLSSSVYSFGQNTSSSSIGKDQSLEIDQLLIKLDTTKFSFYKILIIRDLSELGSDAYEAGPNIMKYLSDEDWDLRVASARALGYLKYKPAISELIKLLKYEPDWRLNYVSILSLGMLKAKEAIPQLEKIKENHWYSLVRDIASQTISAIKDSTQPSIPNSYPNFAFEFFSYENAGDDIDNCSIDTDKAQKRLIYLKGFLVGEDHGEWGGTLKYEDSSGNQKLLLNDNIKSINALGKNTIVIAGLAHLGYNQGVVYQIINFEDQIMVKQILVLPGAPIAIEELKGNELMISTYGGTVILSKKLKLRQVLCKEE